MLRLFFHRLQNKKLLLLIVFVLISVGVFSLFSEDKAQADGYSLFNENVRLIKSSDHSNVYAVFGSQKYLIRNEQIFRSYGLNFNNIQTVSMAEKNRYSLVRLVKDNIDGRVYYLNYEQNLRKHHRTLQAFHAYKNNNPKNIVTVSHEDLSSWPVARLLKSSDGPRVYYIRDNNKAWVPNEQVFNDNNFSWAEVMTVNRADLNSYNTVEFTSEMVSGDSYNQGQIIDQNDTDATSQDVGGNSQLIVTLDSTNPGSKTIPYATRGNIVTALKLRSSYSTSKIRGLTVTKNGILADNKIEAVYLEDDTGNQYGERITFNDRRAKFNLRENPITISKNSEKILYVKVDYTNGTEVYQSASFGIDESIDIQTSGTISGIFPARGNSHMLVAIDGMLGEVEVTEMTVTESTRELVIGTSNVALARFTISEVGDNEDVLITKIILTNTGSARDNSLTDLSLYQGTEKIISGARLVGERVIFDLSDDEVEINKEDSVDFEVRGSIASGNGQTVKLVIEKSTDISAVGAEQNYNITVDGDFPIGQGDNSNENKFAIGRLGFGFYAVDLDDDEQRAYRDVDGANIALFELHNISQDVYLQNLELTVNVAPASAPQFTGEIQIYDVTNTEEIGYISASKVFNQSAKISLNNYKIEDDGIIRVAVRADIPANAVGSNNYRVNIKDFNYKIGMDNTLYTDVFGDPDEGLDGQLFTVAAPTLTFDATDLESEEEDEVEANKNDQQIARWDVTADDDDIKITAITLQVLQGNIFASQGFTEVRIADSSNQANEGDTGSETFTFTDLNIGVSEDDTIDISVVADLSLNAAGKTVIFKITNIDAESMHDGEPVTIVGIGSAGLASDAVSIIEPDED